MSFRDLGPHHEKLAWQKRFVDFQRKRADHEAALLGALGFSTNYIQSKTALSPGQISYRLRKAGIVRADFRNGDKCLRETGSANRKGSGRREVDAAFGQRSGCSTIMQHEHEHAA